MLRRFVKNLKNKRDLKASGDNGFNTLSEYKLYKQKIKSMALKEAHEINRKKLEEKLRRDTIYKVTKTPLDKTRDNIKTLHKTAKKTKSNIKILHKETLKTISDIKAIQKTPKKSKSWLDNVNVNSMYGSSTKKKSKKKNNDWFEF